jgi:D-amino-acid dehydrogenase
MPRAPRAVLDISLGRSNDVHYTLRELMAQSGALWGYFRNSAPGRHARIAALYHQLTRRAAQDHAPLIAAAGVGALIDETGYHIGFRNPAALTRAARDAARVTQEFGLPHEVFDGAEMTEREPLSRELAGAVYWPQTLMCSDPGALVAAYAALFEARGGRLLRGDGESLTRSAAGWSVRAEAGPISARHVVLALGPWTPPLLRRFGWRVAMIGKRGYHCHYPDAPRLRRPLLDTGCGAMLVPMKGGLRLTTGAALTPQAEHDPRQLRHAEQVVGDLMPLGPRGPAGVWSGLRPCLTDMLPATGPVPGQDGLWVNFGHGHHGFTLGPTTGALLAAQIDGDAPPLARALALDRGGIARSG